jgi:hypothetical protein
VTTTISQREESDGRERDAIRKRYGVAFANGGLPALRKALHEDGLVSSKLVNYLIIRMKRLRMGGDFLIGHLREIAYGRRRRGAW